MVASPPTTSTGTSSPPPEVVVLPGVTPRGTTSDASLTTPDGSQRTYRVYQPSAGSTRMPLLVALHGGTGSGAQFEANSGFDELAEANGFVVVYPDGTGIGIGNGRVWNGGGCCGRAQQDRLNVDDVGFISNLIDRIVATYPIDPDRVFVTGHSNGAILAYRLLCELADRVSGAAFQAGTLEVDGCNPARPVSILHIHGAADTNLPINGGRGDGISNTDFASPLESIAHLAELDGCGAPADVADETNPDITRRIWSGCDGGVVVEMLIVAGANHAWMGHASTRLQQNLSGVPYSDLDSSLTIWTFLAGLG